jgi:hypothetical protein
MKLARLLTLVALCMSLALPAAARRTQKRAATRVTAAPAAPAAVSAPAPASSTESAPAPAKQPKVKVYTFGGLDVEGKLKTPQLLYFLNRIKAEFDTSTLDKRSFMKELDRSADDKAL